MLSELVRRCRLRAGLTQAELAERCGLSERAIRNIEGGRVRSPRSATVRLLADVFDLDDASRALLMSSVAGPPRSAVAGSRDGMPMCLPRAVGDFVGRAEETTALLGADLMTVRPAVVAIDGMAGVGKTALALHLAARLATGYPDGQLFVDLHGHSDHDPVEPTAALRLLLIQLGANSEQIPDGLDERTARWRSAVARRRLLIVLDDARDTAQVEPLLPGGSPTITIVTSRRRLGALPDVRRCTLGPLPPGEAVQLLIQATGDDRCARNEDAAGDIARQCGYLPLALRVAAARLASRPALPVRQLAEQLRAAGSTEEALTTEGRSVAAAFMYSYRLLTKPAQQMFRLIALHPAGEFGDGVTAALADTDMPSAGRALDELLDAHLLQSPTPGRYRLHDLLRDFARGLLSPAAPTGHDLNGVVTAALRRMLDYYLHTCRSATSGVHHNVLSGVDWGEPARRAEQFTDGPQATAWLIAEWTNVVQLARLAEKHELHRHTALLAQAVWPFLTFRGLPDVAVDIQLRGLSAAERIGDHHLTAVSHNNLAGTYFHRSMASACLRHLDVAYEMFRATNDRTQRALVLSNKAKALQQVGRYREAIDAALQAEEVADDGDLLSVSNDQVFGGVYRILAEYDHALDRLRRALRAARSHGLSSRVAIFLGELGRVHLDMSHLTTATAVLARAVSLKDNLGFISGRAETMALLGTSMLRQGDSDAALRLQLHAVALIDDCRVPTAECVVRLAYAETLLAVGDAALAVREAETMLRLAQRSELRLEQGQAHAAAAAALEVADPERAGRHRNHATAIFRDLGVSYRCFGGRQPVGSD